MKRTFGLIAILIIMLLPLFSQAQTSSSEDASKSLDIARSMLKAVTGLADDFKSFKGDSLFKDKNGNNYYRVINIDLGTDKQYVVVKANGTTVIVALYSQKDKDDKTPILAFASFTGGIITLTSTTNFSVDQDKSISDPKSLKYFLKINDTKIASFNLNTETKEGTLLVAMQ